MNEKQDPYLKICNLYKSYQSTKIFNGDNISCFKGMTLLAGPNGAGKSTLIKLILGLSSPTSGQIQLYDEEVAQNGLTIQAKQKIGLQLQNDSFLKSVKVKEYIELYQKIYGCYSQRYSIEKVRSILDIDKLLEKYAFNLSGGEKKKVSLFLALVGDKDLIILDEPTAGIDVEVKVKIIEVLNYLRKREINILVSSHDLEDFFENIDYLLLINRGKVFQGSIDNFFEKFKKIYKVECEDSVCKKVNKPKTNLFGKDYFLLREEECNEIQDNKKLELTIKDCYFLLINGGI